MRVRVRHQWQNRRERRRGVFEVDWLLDDTSSILCLFQPQGLHAEHTGMQLLRVKAFPGVCSLLNVIESVESQVLIHRDPNEEGITCYRITHEPVDLPSEQHASMRSNSSSSSFPSQIGWWKSSFSVLPANNSFLHFHTIIHTVFSLYLL